MGKLTDIFTITATKLYCSKISRKFGIYSNRVVLIAYRIMRQKIQSIRSFSLRSLVLRNTLSAETIADLKYQDLLNLKSYDIELFKETANKIYYINIQTIQQKPKIKVVFYLYAVSLWSCERLYRLMEKDEHFEPIVVVTKQSSGTKTTNDDEYTATISYFQTRGYQVLGVADDGFKGKGWYDIGKPDVIILLTPYSGLTPLTFDILHIPLTSLSIYIPYGLMATGNYWVFDTNGAQLCWKYIAETKTLKKIMTEHSELGGFNAMVTGHPKMDVLLKPDKIYNAGDFWKVAAGFDVSQVKKIIYAPHHSIFNETIRFSTFHMNYKEIYEFAKNHLETSWVVKPHQNLRQASVLAGLFKSEEDFDAYMDMWDALPNARTVRSGTYDDIFLTSDAMVMDCGSFLTEYTLTDKPLIFLRRPEQEFTEWGEELLEALYSVEGTDIQGIYDTITQVILNGDDYLAEKRKELLRGVTSVYDSLDGVSTASEYIYLYLKDTLIMPSKN